MKKGGGRVIEIAPLVFINLLRNSDNYIKTIYLNGGCYQFHLILKTLYPKAVPYVVGYRPNSRMDHVITKIDNKYYDITGEVDKSKFYHSRKAKKEDIPIIEKWNFSQHNRLLKCCPHCYEDIYVDIDGTPNKDEIIGQIDRRNMSALIY
jgi:hypothetical protein